MKYLLVLVVVVVVLWLMFGRGRGGAAPSRPAPPPPRGAPPAAAPMLACAHCGVHLPQAEAVLDAGGRPFCSAAHRLAGPR